MYRKYICCICGEEFEGFGNNAAPVMKGTCCSHCNSKAVIPLRLYYMTENPNKTALLLTTSNGILFVEPKDKYFTLKELQDAVGGYIEVAGTFHNRLVICNEEGLLKDLPINKLFKKMSGSRLAGNVLIVPEEIFEKPEDEEEA